MRRKAKLILLFYRSWAFASNFVTAVCVWFIVETSLMLLPLLLLLKTAILALIWYVLREFGGKTRCYYANLGLAPRTLWGWSLAFDLIIFVICTAAAVTYRTLLT